MLPPYLLLVHMARWQPAVPDGGCHRRSTTCRSSGTSWSRISFGTKQAAYRSETNYQRALRAGRLLFGSQHRIEWTPLDETFPRYVRENRERFAHMIAPPGFIGTSRGVQIELA